MSPQQRTAGRATFPVSTALLWASAIVLGAWGASGWWITLQDRSLAMAIMVSATFAVAPIIAAILATLLPRVGLVAKLVASVVILAFVSMDALGNARAFFAFEEVALSAELEDLKAAHEADLKRATDRLDAAQAAFEAVPVPSATGEIRRASTYEMIITPILKEREAAQGAYVTLKAQPAPSVKPLASAILVWIVFSAISLGIVVSFFILADAKNRTVVVETSDNTEAEELATTLMQVRTDLPRGTKNKEELRHQIKGVIEFPGQVSHTQAA